jgi:CRP/FNR family transcriptional regulator, cyclic AMP receptor protein
MTDAILLAPQPLHCGRGKFVAGPVLSSLFDGAALRRLKADEALFVAGDPGDGCYRLEQGLLKVVVTSPRGDERILAMLGPCAIVGELAMLDREPRSASVFAVRDCELSFVSRAEFEKRTIRHPEIYQYLINVMATRLRETDEAMAATSFLTVQARLARAILELGKHVGQDDGAGGVVLRHKIGQGDLAAMAGVARENVSRVMSDWKRNRVVTRSSGLYHLNDIATLKRIMDSPDKAQGYVQPLPSISRASLRASLI